MLSLLYAILLLIIFNIFYKYGNQIYNLDKSETEVRYLLLPKAYQDQFKSQNLRKFYSDIFDENKRDLNLIKSQDNYEKK